MIINLVNIVHCRTRSIIVLQLPSIVAELVPLWVQKVNERSKLRK